MLKIELGNSPLFLGMIFCCGIGTLNSAQPITITFENGTTNFVVGSSGTANYLVSFDSRVSPNSPLTLYFTDFSFPQILTQVTNAYESACTSTDNICGDPMELRPGQKCCLMLNVSLDSTREPGDYTAVAYVGTTEYGSVYSSLAADVPVSVSSDPITAPTPNNFTIAYTSSTDTQAQGTYRVKYTGDIPVNLKATNLNAKLSGNCVGAGEINQVTNCTNPISGAGSCTITFTTEVASKKLCLATSGIEVKGDNTNTLTTSVAFSISGDYVFAFTSPETPDVPQVVSPSVSGDSGWLDDRYYIINAQSKYNGFANTVEINSQSSETAASKCYLSTSSGVAVGTWYLPAICQLGSLGPSTGAECMNDNNTTILNLLQLGFINKQDKYWSSTASSTDPSSRAWAQNYYVPGDYDQMVRSKLLPLQVICARAVSL